MEVGVRGMPWPKEPGRWSASRLGKEKEVDSPLKPPEGMQSCHTFLLV